MLTRRDWWRALAGLLVLGCSRELPAGRALTTTTRAQRDAVPPSSSSGGAAPSVTRSSGVAVVELFTSEGCSSCPPADRVLASLLARAKAESRPVFPLSFHVDYWNDLGWRDRYSRASYSERQRNYGSISAQGGSYTPQAVINGEAECVGSDSSRLDALIEAALQRAARAQIALEARRGEQGIEVSYRVSGETRGRVLNLAVVEPRAESQVERGENAGEHLAHVNVVRGFSTRSLSESNAGTWSWAPDPESRARPLGVIAYVQGTAQGVISGATTLQL